MEMYAEGKMFDIGLEDSLVKAVAELDIEYVLKYGQLEHLALLACVSHEKIYESVFDGITSIDGTDEVSGLLPLEEFRKIAQTKYRLRNKDISNAMKFFGSASNDPQFADFPNTLWDYFVQDVPNKAEYLTMIAKAMPLHQGKYFDNLIKENLIELKEILSPAIYQVIADEVRNEVRNISRRINSFAPGSNDNEIENIIRFTSRWPLSMDACISTRGKPSKTSSMPHLIVTRSKIGFNLMNSLKDGKYEFDSEYIKDRFCGIDEITNYHLMVNSCIEKTCSNLSHWFMLVKKIMDEEDKINKRKVSSDIADIQKRKRREHMIDRGDQRLLEDYQKLHDFSQGRSIRDVPQNELLSFVYKKSLVRDLQGIGFYFLNQNSMKKFNGKLHNIFEFDTANFKDYYALNPLAHNYRAYNQYIVGGKTREQGETLLLHGPISLHMALLQEHIISELGPDSHALFKMRKQGKKQKNKIYNRNISHYANRRRDVARSTFFRPVQEITPQ